jgi:predicted ferric reductase
MKFTYVLVLVLVLAVVASAVNPKKAAKKAARKAAKLEAKKAKQAMSKSFNYWSLYIFKILTYIYIYTYTPGNKLSTSRKFKIGCD